VTGTLAVDGWAVRLLYLIQEGGGTGWSRSLPRPLLAVPNITAHPSTVDVMWHYLWSLKRPTSRDKVIIFSALLLVASR